MVNTVDNQQQEMAAPDPPLTIGEVKIQQAVARRKFTRTCNAIERAIRENGSRGGAKALLEVATQLLAEAGRLNDLLVDEDDYERHHDDHLHYTAVLGTTKEQLDQYLLARADDADSVVPSINANVDEQRRQARAQALEDARQRAATAAAEAEIAADAVRRLQLADELEEEPVIRRCQPRRASNASSESDSNDVTAPDEWIEAYHRGSLAPVRRAASRSSVKADLEPFSGRALDWFGWVDLFRALVHDTEKDPGEKLAILKRNLRGDCRDLVYGLGGGEQAYMEALLRLKQAYGRRDVMRAAHALAIERLEFKPEPAVFKRYAEKVRTHLFDLSRVGETAVADIIERICLRLPLADRVAWTSGRGGELETRTLNHFGSWLCQRASAYQNALSIAAEQLETQDQHKQQQKQQQQHRRQARTNKTEGKTNPPKGGRPFCFRCEGDHRLEHCPQFKSASVGDRVGFCIRHRLCFSCFGTRHSSRDCSLKKACQQPGCQLQHHALLHDNSAENPPQSARPHTTQTAIRKVALGAIQLDAVASNGAIVPVTVMLDEGSDTTLVRESFARRLQLPGTQQTLEVEGVGGIRSTIASKRVRFQLQNEAGRKFDVDGSTMRHVTRPVTFVDWERLKQRWSHLADLPLRSSGGHIDVLLGLDQAHLMAVLESRGGTRDEPIASKTALGWIIRGVVDVDSRPLAARILTVFGSTEESLTDAVKQFCNTENYGTEHQTAALSVDEQRAVSTLEQGTRKLELGYEVPITWRVGEPDLPNNRPLAEKRMNSLLRRFQLEPAFEKDYRAAMTKNFEKGYAVVVEEEKTGETEYFVPHHGVYKGPKLRVVFDAAARYHGKSLNDSIISGPPLQTPLPAVLIKFREGEVAWASDVEAMFSRIRLRQDDARFFRFLWRREGENSNIVCEMKRLPFGATCSPFIAISTTRRIPVDAKATEEIVRAISERMYVDDYLSSSKTVPLGVAEAISVRDTLATGDLHLQGWISNSTQFLQALTGEDRIAADGGVNLAGDGDAEKVLGIVWRPQSDTLGFRVEESTVTYTRVGLLSKVASIFDPLGAAAPLTVKAKIRLRLLGTKGLDWSDAVTEEDRRWWEEWFATLQQLNDIRTKRCLFPDEDNIIRSELHTFGDASEEAYAAVVYLRNVYNDGRVEIHQLKASTKLAPKQTISVPRLELNASLLAARLARFVTNSLSRKIHKRYFWTDSSTVRNWIRATASFYQTFVSNRVGEIQTLTEPLEWRFVPGKLNPADAATRSTIGEEAIPLLWTNGPSFLLDDEEQWPLDLPWMTATEELRSVRAHHTLTSAPTFDWGHVNIRKQDIPALARLASPFVDYVKRCQAESYEDELRRLKKKKTLRPSSSLLSLSPFIGEDGLLRLGSRAVRVKLPYDRVHPPLLPGRHPLTRKVIEAFHEELSHVGTDFLLSYIQQYFWITSGREAIKKVRRDCRICRRNRAQPGQQLMGDLPDSRLDFGTPPFSNAACDLFGPMEVGFARNRTTKRWGVLFTCMVTRAVYLDLVPTLSTDDFLLAMRRFIGVYGKPKRLHSDNGTNFVGAERELREAAQKLYASAGVAHFFKDKEIDWSFQPPRTPHFGGAHESLVRSTKKALYQALENEAKKWRHPTEDTLRTILFEIAGLLNSRPLTYTSSDPEDFRPLTPNDFLNRPPNADPPAGSFDDALPREHYRYVQRALNIFWDIWKTTFLQSLAARKRWNLPQRNFAIGDVVMEIDNSLGRGQWSMGHVVAVFPGADGLVRAVDVQLPTGVFRRGIQRLCLLEPASTSRPSTAEPASGEDVPATTD